MSVQSNKDKIKQEENWDIPFILGGETRPKIERFVDDKYSVKIKKSIFYKQYCTALAGIAELLNYQVSSQLDEQILRHNNIFIFTGDRGSGKTSCLLTVKELLCKKNNRRNRYAEFEDVTQDLRDKLYTTEFQFFGIIDPIYFDCHHNILDLFMGKLFNEFQQKEQSSKDFIYERKKDVLLRQFSETKRNLSLLNKTVELSEFDDLEQLCDLSASIAIKQSLDKLVQCYVEYMYTSDTQLVLCIDDIDLNISEGYEMVEQIRKYLNIKGLIILMAIKIDQLGNVIRIKYSTDFGPLLRLDSKNNTSQKYDKIINEIVERYVTKIFPISHRIQLPTVTYLLDQKIGIFQYDNNRELKWIENLEPLKDGILNLIYKKFRMLVYNSRSRISYIIPQNLRELLNLIHLLYNMQDADNHSMAIPNLLRFKDYFYDVWCTNNLDEEDLIFLRNARNVMFAPKVNQMVVRMLDRRFTIFEKLKGETGKTDNSIQELINILDSENVMYNISLGDVLACLDWLDKVCDEEKDMKLLFAIKVFYSVYLYEGFGKNKEIQSRKEKFETEVVNQELLTDNQSDYGDILNGNFFNSEYINVAPYENGEISRCRRVISGERLAFGAGDVKDDNKILQQKITDFFILTTAFVFNAKERSLENNGVFFNYRKKEEVYYEKKIGKHVPFICFDILSIFYNLLDVEKSFCRYGRGITELEKTGKDKIKEKVIEIFSEYLTENELDLVVKKEIRARCRINMSPLYKDILNKCTDELPSCVVRFEKDGIIIKDQFKELIKDFYFWKEENMLYRLNIRNVELLEQISYRLQRKRPNGSSNNI